MVRNIVQLSFSRGRLIRHLRLFTFVAVLLAAYHAAAIWYRDPFMFAPGLILMSATLWCFAKTAWLIRSRAPAAEAGENGIRIQNCASHRTIPWSQILSIVETELGFRGTQMEVVQIRRRARPPIAFPLEMLCNSRREIERWIEAARMHLTP
jgi:hypothetical protein